MTSADYGSRARFTDGLTAMANIRGFTHFDPYSAQDRMAVLAAVTLGENTVPMRPVGRMIEFALLEHSFPAIWQSVVPEDLEPQLGLCAPVAYRSFYGRENGRTSQTRQHILRIFPEHAMHELIAATRTDSESPRAPAAEVMKRRYENIATANNVESGVLYKFLESLKGTRGQSGLPARENQATLYPLIYAAADTPEHLSGFLRRIIIHPTFGQWKKRTIEGEEFSMLEELVGETA